MRKFAIAVAFAALVLTACQAKEEPKPEEAPPPPPTADELYAKLRSPLDPMFNAGASNAPFSNAQRTAAVQGLQPVKQQMNMEINAQEAFKRMQRELEDLIRSAKTKENWRVVKGGIEAFKIFQPGEKRYDADEEYADLILARPTVTVRGFFETDEPTVFVEVADADTGKKSNYKIREGEDFHETLQLVRIIGRRDGIELLYKPVNQQWTVQAPSQ